MKKLSVIFVMLLALAAVAVSADDVKRTIFREKITIVDDSNPLSKGTKTQELAYCAWKLDEITVILLDTIEEKYWDILIKKFEDAPAGTEKYAIVSEGKTLSDATREEWNAARMEMLKDININDISKSDFALFRNSAEKGELTDAEGKPIINQIATKAPSLGSKLEIKPDATDAEIIIEVMDYIAGKLENIKSIFTLETQDLGKREWKYNAVPVEQRWSRLYDEIFEKLEYKEEDIKPVIFGVKKWAKIKQGKLLEEFLYIIEAAHHDAGFKNEGNDWEKQIAQYESNLDLYGKMDGKVCVEAYKDKSELTVPEALKKEDFYYYTALNH